MRLVYNISISLYHLGIRVASLFNKKAKLWVKGRKNIWQELTTNVKPQTSNIIWVHCASVGEFEQGRPLIEKIRIQNTGYRILITFFSPSGYELRKNYEQADWVFYLPIDSPGNARRFLDIVKPEKAFFIKYEFWFNYLAGLKERNVPTYLVSGIFRADQYFFSGRGGWSRKQLKAFSHFFVQDEASQKLLASIGYTNVTVSGDTRFDRVAQVVSAAREIPLAQAFAGVGTVLVAGSTWEIDERILAACKPKMKIIVVPHEVHEEHMKKTEEIFSYAKTIRFSKATTETVKEAGVLIVDSVGMLSSLYRYGSMAYVGGGFGKGIHNILEAAAYGIPVMFGPEHRKFAEAADLLKQGGAFEVKNAAELQKTFALLTGDAMVMRMASEICRNYTRKKTGATEVIYHKAFSS